MGEEPSKAPISGGNFLANALRSRRGDRSAKVAIKFIGPGNPSCSEADIRFRQRAEKVARPLSLQSPGFASRIRHGISPSLDWPAA
jgi:hypothetical protein